MNSKYTIIIVRVLLIITSSFMAPLQGYRVNSLITGAIQFPKSVTTIPMIRVYAGGNRVPYALCEANPVTKRFTYSVPSYGQQQFYLAITDSFTFSLTPTPVLDSVHNTIGYLKIDPKHPYKLYKIDQIASDAKAPLVTWHIQEESVDVHTGRIPDNAIIIRYDPTLVARIEEGNALELPTIVLCDNLVEMIGSQSALTDSSNLLLLASLDTDTIHPKMEQAIKHLNQKTLIVPTL